MVEVKLCLELKKTKKTKIQEEKTLEENKTEEVKEEEKVEVPPEMPWDNLEEFYLTEEEKFGLLYYDARIKNAELSLRLQKLDVRDKIRQLEFNLNVEKTICKDRLKQLRDQVEEKYKIKLSEYSFFEETGKLTKLPTS